MTLPRRNMVVHPGERWRPPTHLAPKGPMANSLIAVRRLLDLQAASLWRDMKTILPKTTGTLVDVGCGAQPYRLLVPSHVKYIGIDTADAKVHFGYEIPDTIYFTGDRWPIESAGATVILATETMEHVFNFRQFLAEAARCVRAGGQLILTVPFSARWHFIPNDYWRYTPSTLNLILTEAGFESIRVYARGNEVTVACYKVMALILPLLMPQNASPFVGILLRLVGLLLSPLLLVMACVAQLSLCAQGGDDCLGYTVVATRKGAEA